MADSVTAQVRPALAAAHFYRATPSFGLVWGDCTAERAKSVASIDYPGCSRRVVLLMSATV